ncbi:Orotidine 5'-phosphate decarboxylase [uncultured Desulfobacterium sp.]|uniref:Orotidine 5'-phosphate decarboxylase n=1 Tax=uncultured Desulfobacterium sp. TaxID=201089 RepID=A0A445MX65_9BACT|nr:Orotidine 5'-phosphate decarboxylase [uncultured Desulfobacterium sp.]
MIREPKDYIIFPLDMPDYDQAMHYVEMLKDHIGLFKVGLELFISQGPEILSSIRKAGGAGIFLDLKLHDIPATVKRAFMAASRHLPEFVSVHCDEGKETLKGIAESSPKGTKILAITVLTSLNQKNLSELGYREEFANDLSRLVLLKARIAKEAGCHGIVCSGHEVAMIKEALGADLIAVTPGIRPQWSIVGQDDQKRIVTPGTAVKMGADYIVVGRPIRDANDPVRAARLIADEIAKTRNP